MPSSRVTVNTKSTTAPKRTKKTEQVAESDNEEEQEEVKAPTKKVEKQPVKKTPVRNTKKKVVEPEPESESESEDEHKEPEQEDTQESDNDVTKWEADESERVIPQEELKRKASETTEEKKSQPQQTQQTEQHQHHQHQQQHHSRQASQNKFNRGDTPQVQRRQQHRDTQNRDTQHRDTQHRDTQNRDTQNRPRSTALNYLYQDYRKVDHPLCTLNTQDILRHLIVRAHDDGQTGLKRCLEATLRAVNLECDFPALSSNKPHRETHDIRNKKSHAKPNIPQTVDEE